MHSETQDSEYPQFIEVDPTGRYGRYDEVLGKGASKTVFRAFDEYEGIEVAWNQVKLNDFLQSSGDLERLYCEIHLLKTLKHKNIMKFYASWVDTSKRKINFVTEMFTSGTLRQFRQKHRRVNIRAVKNWCRQILSGLLYLHNHDPPIIHRDLKCDNIFINGNQGEVKIGDLGLAEILRKPQADHCVGTPEFMAPEMYEEAYNELVDIYSFGMCILEMVTFEYPYSECTHPAQIYKRVISGRKPKALYKVKDPEVRLFVEKCLATVSKRLSARELLNDPFLQIDEPGLNYWEGDITAVGEILRQPSYIPLHSDGSLITGRLSSDDLPYCMMLENRWEWDAAEHDTYGFEPFHSPKDQSHTDLEITIKGMRRDDGSIFLSLRISDREGYARNINFPFDIANDTALGVATEMVGELNITDHDVTHIAEMIDGEVASLVPEWKPGLDIEEMSGNREANVSSTCSLLNYLSVSNQDCASSLNATSCSHVDCALHGRFEEITYHVKELECSTSQSDDLYSSNLDEEDRHIDHTSVESSHFRELKVENEIASSSMHKPFQASVLKPLKSFHFGTNFSYRVSSSDILQGDSTNMNKCSGNSGNGIFAERSFCSGFHHESNVLSAKDFPADAVDVGNA